ncbi:PAS domain S-box protein [Candidatus Ferrigenium straubiae]|jgi:PAS domain S-box-containing protein|uniref:PAS domain-containing hybrid sensor histidine kinase/response regulator n=1 Tax=Candidatus Ferrigenium straubiae TaxID=2919506 RepID=UPI003F4ACD0D
MTATILVIDDSEDDRRLYRRALKDVDCRFVMASSAKDGFICMADHRPDVILLDYNLPDLDGLSLVKVLAGCSGPPAPLIMLTGEGSESVAVEVMKLGASDYLVKDTAGQYLRLLPGVIERVMASHAQREQNRRLMQETERLLHRNRILMQNSADGIHVMDGQGNIVEANDAFCRMLGYSQEEAAGLNVADWDAQWTAEELLARFKEIVGQSAVFETLHCRKDGTLINVEISASHVEMDGQDFFFALSRDITERKRAQRETETLLLRNQALMQTSMDGIHVMDMQGNIMAANDAFCRMLGYTQEEIGSLNVADWERPLSVEEFRARFRDIVGCGAIFETQYYRKDGTLFDVEISSSGVRLEGQNFIYASSRDVTERKRVEQALVDADRHKDEFLAMLAHELRNPLAPIRNAAHVIGRLELAEPRIKWAQETIERQVAHLARLVDDLLDVSRIARGKILLKWETIEFAALAEQVMQAARPLAESNGHELTVRLPEEAVQMDGDPVRLSQVLFNLLDNAIKYTPDGGRIEFAARMAGPEIEISVRDSGMGIRAELQPRVFDMFQQDERKLDRAQGGLGIGLTLVQRLVGMHGGRVEVYSAGPGQGSTFTVRLPARVMSAPLHVPEPASRHGFAVGMRVLLVEDDPAVADSTAVLLEMEGHEVRIAESGQVALEQVPEFRPQVVLLDIGLKGMDGFETAQRLRQLPEGYSLCLVAVTGYADSAIRAQARASGCDHFLVKPVTFKALNELLSGMAGAAPAHASV